MIRPAKFFDAIRIVDLLEEMQQSGRYVTIDEVDEKAAHQLVTQAIQRHGGSHYGGAHVMVAEHDGLVQGFIIGMLDRVYHIGKRLMANDVFLYCTKDAEKADFMRLLNSYVSWADANPKVAKINLSWTDALPDAERIEKVYGRLGFRRCGAIWERDRSMVELEVAA